MKLSAERKSGGPGYGLRHLLLVMMIAGGAKAYAQTAPLFMAGDLNPHYMGRAASIVADVLEIRSGPGNKPFFLVDPGLSSVSPFWISSFAPVISGQIAAGDRLRFIGHVRTAESLERSGVLAEFLDGKPMLIARSIQTLRTDE